MFAADNVYTTGLASDSGGEHLDPPEGEILATTDMLPAGKYHILVSITAVDLDDSRALFEIQRRNALDEENNLVESAIVSVPIDNTKQFEFAFALESCERITVVPYPIGFNGRVMVALNWQQVA